MPENQTQLLHEVKFVEDRAKASKGVELLSPTLHYSIQQLTSEVSSSHSTKAFDWNFISSTSDTPYAEDWNEIMDDGPIAIEFDFDRFTLASLCGKEQKGEQDAMETLISLNSRHACRNTIDNDQKLGSTEERTLNYDDNSDRHPHSCSMSSVITTTTIEDLAMSRRQQQYSFMNTETQRDSIVSRSSEEHANRGTFRMSSTASSAGFLMAKKKELTSVVMCGWLQKRKRLVFKRWKPYYCLWKSDDSFCLYTSEDTVNGRLEQRYQILRVVLTDKNNSFHIIGIDSKSVPRREEFRVTSPTDWIRWFQVFGRFFDESSMKQALFLEPGLQFAKSLSKAEEEHWHDYDCDIDPLADAVVPRHMNFQAYGRRHSCFTPRKQPSTVARASFEGNCNERVSTRSLFSRSSSFLSMNTDHETPDDAITSQIKSGLKIYDCPMIECIDQVSLPILEIRASESNSADYLQLLPSDSLPNEEKQKKQ